MLAQAAISIANTQRWALDRVLRSLQTENATALPESADSERTHAYEVTVVDTFVQLGQQSFAAHGSTPMWERPLRTGKRGRPKAIDVSLFNKGNSEESRIEFGMHEPGKLAEDAQKLLGSVGDALIDYHQWVRNYIIIWRERGEPNTQSNARAWVKLCEEEAKAVITPLGTVALLIASSVDLFAEEAKQHRVADVALYEATLAKP